MIAPRVPTRRRLLMLAPFGVVAAGGVAFWTMLDRMGDGRFDPHDIGNPLLGKAMPEFSLGPVAGGQGFSSADVRAAAQTRPVLLNFFASWCVPCAEEAPALAFLHDQGVAIWGVTALAGAYKDKPDKIAGFLDRYGNPYARLGADMTGSAPLDFGLLGVPESFVIDRAGRIAGHLGGPLTERVIDGQLMPALQKAGA